MSAGTRTKIHDAATAVAALEVVMTNQIWQETFLSVVVKGGVTTVSMTHPDGHPMLMFNFKTIREGETYSLGPVKVPVELLTG
jgi:hypothetical protein